MDWYEAPSDATRRRKKIGRTRRSCVNRRNSRWLVREDTRLWNPRQIGVGYKTSWTRRHDGDRENLETIKMMEQRWMFGNCLWMTDEKTPQGDVAVCFIQFANNLQRTRTIGTSSSASIHYKYDFRKWTYSMVVHGQYEVDNVKRGTAIMTDHAFLQYVYVFWHNLLRLVWHLSYMNID